MIKKDPSIFSDRQAVFGRLATLNDCKLALEKTKDAFLKLGLSSSDDALMRNIFSFMKAKEIDRVSTMAERICYEIESSKTQIIERAMPDYIRLFQEQRKREFILTRSSRQTGIKSLTGGRMRSA